MYHSLSTNAQASERTVQRPLGDAGNGLNTLNPRKQKRDLIGLAQQSSPVRAPTSDLRPFRVIVSIAVSF